MLHKRADKGNADGRRERALVDICTSIATKTSDRDLINRILEIVCDAFGAEVCTLRLLDEASGVLVLSASVGLSDYSKPVRLGESVVGRSVLERKPYAISNIAGSAYKSSELVRKHGLQSLVSVPLLLKDRAIGGLTLYSTHAAGYQPADIRLIIALATQLATVIENTQLIRDTVSTLVSLARAIEAKDPYTHGHSERVTAYAVGLAEIVGMAGQDLAVLKQVAPMHDIGKIGISERIIHKPARLSPKERMCMEEHPVIGETIVNSIRSLQPGLYLIRNHHERLDGKGYPDGLNGDEIPYAARIIAIADAYDAMTSKRPYRDPLALDAAIEELHANAGTQFDAGLVEAFADLDRPGLTATD
jgi:putative methionine-R-sulfoxide reductase with GAF domain